MIEIVVHGGGRDTGMYEHWFSWEIAATARRARPASRMACAASRVTKGGRLSSLIVNK